MRMTLATIAAAAFLAGATPALAQPAPWEAERLTAGWTFVPALGVGGFWDSNTTLRSSGDPQLREWAGRVNPRGELNFNGPRSRFNFGYSGSLEAYRTLDELTRYDQRGRLQAVHRMTPRLTLRAQSALSVSPTTDRLELDGLPFERVGAALYSARGGADYSLSSRTAVSGEYEYQWIAFDRDRPTPGLLTGGYSNSAIANLRHQLTRRLTGGAAYTLRRATTEGRVRHVTIQDALGIGVIRLAENTTFEAGAGLAYLRIADTDETRIGPSLRASLRHGLSRARLEVGYEKSFVPSWTFGGTTVNEQIRASLRVPFAAGRAFVQGSTTFRHNEPLTTGRGLTLDGWLTGASLGYAFAPWLRVEGFYNGSFQTSSARGEVDRTRIGIQFVTLKPVRIQ